MRKSIKKIGQALVFCFGFVLLPTCMLMGCEDVMRKDLLAIEEATGTILCSRGERKKFVDIIDTSQLSSDSMQSNEFVRDVDLVRLRMRVLEEFDRAKNFCLSFDEHDASNLLFGPPKGDSVRDSGYVEINDWKVPVIINRGKSYQYESQDNPKNIFVRVPGGPGGTEIDSFFGHLIDYFDDTLVIDFYYTGNGFNTIHPEPSFDTASAQVAHFVRELRSLNPDAKIVLVGESLGAVISASAAKELVASESGQSKILDSVVLLSPPFARLDETAQTLNELFGRGGPEDRMVYYRVRNTTEDYNEFGEIKKLDWLDVFEGFYKEEEGRVTLFERLRHLRAELPILVVYGSSDERISVMDAEQFAQDPLESVEVLRIDGMGHQFNPGSDGRLIRDVMADFLGL